MFRGYFAAVVTPWRNGELDLESFEPYIERLIVNGISGIVVCGTTGEAPLLNESERKKLISAAVSIANDRISVIAGVGGVDTNSCIAQVKATQQSNVDALMVTCPYYVKPSQEGIFQHYKAIHDSTKLPLLLYNVPSRTGVDIATDTVKRMVKYLPRVCGLKEATNNLVRITELTKSFPADRFQVLCGNDEIMPAAFAMGACGAVSVTANITPMECVNMYKEFFAGNHKEFAKIRDVLQPIHDAMFIEANPVPVKYALHLMGEMLPDVRPCLTQLSDESKKLVKLALTEAGILCPQEK